MRKLVIDCISENVPMGEQVEICGKVVYLDVTNKNVNLRGKFQIECGSLLDLWQLTMERIQSNATFGPKLTSLPKLNTWARVSLLRAKRRNYSKTQLLTFQI